MALSNLTLCLSYTWGGHSRLRALLCPALLLLCRPPLRWVLGVHPSPLFVSSTTQSPRVVHPSFSLHPPPPNHLASSTPPPLIATSATQSPCVVCPPLLLRPPSLDCLALSATHSSCPSPLPPRHQYPCPLFQPPLS
jgi:hypothetical protein